MPLSDQLLKPVNRSMVLVDDDPRTLLDRFESYAAPTVTKWIRTDQT